MVVGAKGANFCLVTCLFLVNLEARSSAGNIGEAVEDRMSVCVAGQGGGRSVGRCGRLEQGRGGLKSL